MAIAPLQGWMLARVVSIDEHQPGFAAHVLRASPERRQVIAAFLAMSKPCSSFRSDAETGWFLCHANHEAILRAAFGSVPNGMRGALGRVGPHPCSPRFYALLHRLLASSEPDVAKVITRLERVDAARLRIVRLLPSDMRHPAIVNRLRSVRDALDLRSFVAQLADLGVGREELITTFAAAPSREAYTGIARRWSLKVVLPAHPVPASTAYQPVLTGAELRRLALRYRNCMRSYLTNTLEHRSSFAEFSLDGETAVVHLVARKGQWWLDDLYGKHPGNLCTAFIRAAEAYLKSHGVERVISNGGEQRLDPLRRLLKHVDPERFIV